MPTPLQLLCSTALSLFFVACGSDGTTEACTKGQPVAIFSEALPRVVGQEFSAEGQSARELVRFDNQLQLEILQAGCQTITQEFRFTWPEEIPEAGPEEWRRLAAEQFHFLGDVGERYRDYHLYARVIEELGVDLPLAQAINLGNGQTLRLDRITGGGRSTIIVELKQ
ncbi:MAG: hypothetical protein AAFW73_21225 [Bacteroidota bacterium]